MLYLCSNSYDTRLRFLVRRSFGFLSLLLFKSSFRTALGISLQSRNPILNHFPDCKGLLERNHGNSDSFLKNPTKPQKPHQTHPAQLPAANPGSWTGSHCIRGGNTAMASSAPCESAVMALPHEDFPPDIMCCAGRLPLGAE